MKGNAIRRSYEKKSTPAAPQKKAVAASLFIRPGFLNLILSAVQILFFAAFLIAGDVQGFTGGYRTVITILYGFITVNLLGLLVEGLSFNIRPLKRILSFILLFFLFGGLGYHFSVKAPVDSTLVADNIGISFSGEALTVILSAFKFPVLVLWFAFIAFMVFIELRFSLLVRTTQEKPLLSKAVFAAVMYLCALIIPLPSGDEITLVIKEAIFAGTAADANIPIDKEYPYLRKTTLRPPAAAAVDYQKPNIIIIMIESFNANYAENRSPEGYEYTPVFNSLIPKGIYAERFYGNSIQTCKGQAAAFYSILPSSKGKIFVDFPDLSIQGFPSVLRDNGYHTIFFQAYQDLKFDNTAFNMKKAGFSTIKNFKEYQRREDKEFVWGWGPEDRIFYTRFFDMLDEDYNKNPGKPLFAALATVGTHVPCDGMPEDHAPLYKKAKGLKQRYANALNLSDSALQLFFDMMEKRPWLKNTVVIITADHSFPMSEHGVFNNEVCHYEETFRIPFLLIWDGVLAPERIQNRPYSLMDLAPTVLECAGISYINSSFQGISVFNRKESHPVYLIQPYNGKFLEVIRWPYKYGKHLRTGDEFIYDLSADPGEKNNIINTVSAENKDRFRNDLTYFFINQKLIETDRVWRAQQ